MQKLKYFTVLAGGLVMLTGCAPSETPEQSLVSDAAIAAFDPKPDMLGLWVQSVDAYDVGDVELHYLAMLEYERRRPYGEAIQRYLARAELELGYPEQALDRLRGVADRGMAIRVDGAPGFDAIGELEGVEDIKALYEANMAPQGRSDIVFEIEETGILPEGIAYNYDTGSYYIGSVRYGDIYERASDGTVTKIISGDHPSMYGAFGMTYGAEKLAIATSYIPGIYQGDKSQPGPTGGVSVFDMSGETPQSIFVAERAGEERVVGDLAFSENGVSLLSDSFNPELLEIGMGVLNVLPLGAAEDVPNPQGITFGGGDAFLADYHRGLIRIANADTAEAEVAIVPIGMAEELNENIGGIDGLYYYQADLIAIQNGTAPQRIIRVKLSDEKDTVIGVEVLAQNLPEWFEPTLGVIVGDELHYVATSQWPIYLDDGSIREGAPLLPVRVMQISLN